jgi:AmmeMemoRadiSam system protein B
MNIRESVVNGHFYPHSCEEVTHVIKRFEAIEGAKIKSIDARAIIAPHAGYVYSGRTATIAYASAQASLRQAKRIVVIGPSHRVRFEGASVSLYDSYRTPCGEHPIDLNEAKKFHDNYEWMHFHPQVHAEHSTETQLPLIHHYAPNIPIVEIIYGSLDPTKLSDVIQELLNESETFVIISTDLSHFYDLSQAHKLDQICIDAITQQELSTFDQGCEACGIIGVKAITECSKQLGFKSTILDYSTSDRQSGDTSSVVGYLSTIIHR